MEQINVTKRNGINQRLDLNKILNRVRKQSEGLEVNADEVGLQTIQGLFDGVTSTQLDDLAARIAAEKNSIHPDYSTLAARITISRLHKEIKGDVKSYLKRTTEMLEDGLVCYLSDSVVEKLKKWQKEIDEIVDFNRDYNFDYFGINTMIQTYLLRTANGVIIERPQHVYMRTALHLTNTLAEFKEYYDQISCQFGSPATPILMNAGSIKSTLVSCSLHQNKNDNLESIMQTMSEIARHSADSSGIGLCVDNLRSSNSRVRRSGGFAHGIVPYAKIVQDVMIAYNQCYSDDTLVATNDGFKLFKDLSEEDLIAQVDKTTKKVSFIKPLSLTSYEYKGEMYRVKSNHIDLLITPNHKVAYEEKVNGVWEGILKLEEIQKLTFDENIRMWGYDKVSNYPINNTPVVTKQQYDGMVYCCEVETGILGVKRNGKSVYCGNSGKRKGSCALYMSVWHDNIFEFLQLKKQTGDEKLRARDIFLAVNVPNNFMEAVEKDGDYYLFCPNTLKKNGITSFMEIWGKEFEHEYNRAVDMNLGRKVKAREILRAIQEIQIEAGMPYIHFIDHTNDKSNHQHYGKVKQSNLCVGGDTKILTNEGYKEIRGLVGEQTTIWNGYEWSDVVPFKTSDNEQLFDVYINGVVNKKVRCTAYHKWYIIRNNENIVVQTKDLFLGDTIQTYTLPKSGEIDGEIVSFVDRIYEKESTFCLTEPKNNTFIANGVLTGNCAEITEFTDENTTAQCCLSAMPLFKYVINGKFDFDLLEKNVGITTRRLNTLIDVNEYSTEAARKGGLEQRAIAIGMLGLADTFFKLDLSFTSPEAKALNIKIQETIYYTAIKESCQIAKENGHTYLGFKESNMGKGIFQFDMWGVKCDSEKWVELKKDVAEYGLYNSLFSGLMPTAGTSNLVSCYESFEPQNSNIFIRNTLSGEFVIFNRYLIKDLQRLNVWCEQLRKEIILGDGSVQNIDFQKYVTSNDLTEGQKRLLVNSFAHIKEKYKTVWEIKQKELINMAADRAIFVDQSQSMNLYVKNPDHSVLSSMYLYAWKKGLKTGVYYLRSQTKLDANKAFSINNNVKSTAVQEEADCIGCAV